MAAQESLSDAPVNPALLGVLSWLQAGESMYDDTRDIRAGEMEIVQSLEQLGKLESVPILKYCNLKTITERLMEDGQQALRDAMFNHNIWEVQEAVFLPPVVGLAILLQQGTIIYIVMNTTASSVEELSFPEFLKMKEAVINESIRELPSFLNGHAFKGTSFRLNDRITSVEELRAALAETIEYLRGVAPDTPYADLHSRFQELGLEKGWGGTAKTVLENVGLLLRRLEQPGTGGLSITGSPRVMGFDPFEFELQRPSDGSGAFRKRGTLLLMVGIQALFQNKGAASNGKAWLGYGCCVCGMILFFFALRTMSRRIGRIPRLLPIVGSPLPL